MKKVFITGGMGFIGRNLVKKLLNETDYHLDILDNLSSSLVSDELLNNPRINFIESDFSAWEVPEDANYDQIYHLAGPVGPVRVLEFSGRIAQIIVSQLYKAADMAIAMGAKLMFISTSEVYGEHVTEGTPETVSSVVPSDVTVRLEYGVSKLIGEIILKNLSRVSDLKYNCVRPFNIVGPGQNGKGGFVIPRFLEKAQAGEPITVYNEGNMVRAFTHVEDFVNALYSIMESEVFGEVFNIGNAENTITILELAKKVKEATNTSSEIIHVDPKKLYGDDFEEAWDKIPNVDKLVNMIGWKAEKSVDDIIREIVELGESKEPTQDFSI